MIVLIATLEMTPSVNGLYMNKIGSGKRPGGRIMKPEHRTLKDYLVLGMAMGTFKNDAKNNIHYYNREESQRIRDMYHFTPKTRRNDFPYHIHLDFEFHFNDPRCDGDNRIKFLHDCYAESMGMNDTLVSDVHLKRYYQKDGPAYTVMTARIVSAEIDNGRSLLDFALYELSMLKHYDHLETEMTYETPIVGSD